ncbi:glutamine-hydrolyzing carbamoyl-phosphate synthase small subunit [bacterium]|nr:glutamine-hydrolyzing carbamoyl-phosphate synthase small subunit [bacterium]
MKPGALILEGTETIFRGALFGATVSAADLRKNKDRGYGEVVFNTSLTGYQEILTDPSYYGQIVTMTTPHIGNTGVNLEDPESKHPWCAGFVVHQKCEEPSNWRSNGNLNDYLLEHGIPGISGVDTRALTRFLRSRGVVRGVILPESEIAQAAKLLKELPPFEGRDLIAEVSTPKSYAWERSQGVKPQFKVVVVDFGVKWNLLRSLAAHGCDLEVVPAKTSAQEILSRKPHGIFLSNGPGDPAAAPYASEMVKGVLGKVPLFGVCMGHQILSIALGGRTYKLKFGHRGGNQPVFDRTSERVEISSHNHGYSVDEASLPKSVKVTHVNLNDKTVEGLAVEGKDAFSVQYHPEACPGPHDSVVLFDRFVESMKRFWDGKSDVPKIS